MVLMYLKQQFLEKVGTSLCLFFTGHFLLVHVSIVKERLQSLFGAHFLFGIDQIRFVYGLLQVHIHHITCWKDMAHIHVLDKGFQAFGALFNLLLVHGLGDLAGVGRQTSYQTVTETLVRSAVFKGLDDHGLFSRVTTRQQNDNLAGF